MTSPFPGAAKRPRPRPYPEPADQVDLRRLHDAIDAIHATIQPDTFTTAGPSLTCREAEALADLLRSIGLDPVADRLIHDHGVGDDDPEDDHHEIYLAEQEAGA